MLAAPSLLGAQTLLSDFSGPAADGWTGTINGPTTFANGFTATSGVTDGGVGDVVELTDGGFGGGAIRVYSGAPTTGIITVFGDMRIKTDPGTLAPNLATPQYGTCFGLGAGSTGLGDQAFGWSSSLSTSADDTGSAFVRFAAAVRADGSGDIMTAISPDINDWSVGSGTWDVEINTLTIAGTGTTTTLSDFEVDADGWAKITGTNSPFADGFTSVSQADESGNGVLVVSDGGFGGGAFKNYASALPGDGVHTITVRAKVVTDNGSIEKARIAAAVGGATTNFGDLAFSQSFATTADDTGSAFQDVAIAVSTTATSDLALYVLPDYDAGVGSGAYEIRIDDVTIESGQTLPVELDMFLVD